METPVHWLTKKDCTRAKIWVPKYTGGPITGPPGAFSRPQRLLHETCRMTFDPRDYDFEATQSTQRSSYSKVQVSFDAIPSCQMYSNRLAPSK
jgi:hypothetical protein